jgi:hypothetical protein
LVYLAAAHVWLAAAGAVMAFAVIRMIA